MNFKKPKDDVIHDVYYRVDNSLRVSMHDMLMRSGGREYQMGPNMEALMYAITVAITEATRTIIENVYTDADFEKDIGLTEKD